jgi:hypothetical protein
MRADYLYRVAWRFTRINLVPSLSVAIPICRDWPGYQFPAHLHCDGVCARIERREAAQLLRNARRQGRIHSRWWWRQGGGAEKRITYTRPPSHRVETVEA